MEKKLKYLFEWRDATLGDSGPESPFTRLVLLTLSTHMDLDGKSCFPSQRLLAKETKLSRRAIGIHLRKAEQDGWIIRESRNGKGQGWKRHKYIPKIPKGGEPGSLPLSEKVGNHIPHVTQKGGEPHAEGGEPDDKKVGNHVPLSSSVSSSESSSGKEPLPTNEEIKESALGKVKSDIKTVADKLHQEKHFLRVHEFVNTMLNNKMNPRAILHALTRGYLKTGINPHYWPYCQKIVEVEDGNYNAQQYAKVNFSETQDKPMYRYVDEVVPKDDTDRVPISEAQERIGKLANSMRGM